MIDERGVGDVRQAALVAMRQALRVARLAPEDIGHVHAHGVATRRSDAEEAQAISELFGSRKEPVPVLAAKSYLGNTGAACGAIELIASVMALQNGGVFPVLNYQTPDPDCPVHVATSRDTPAGDSFVNVNVTPLGQASAVVVKQVTSF